MKNTLLRLLTAMLVVTILLSSVALTEEEAIDIDVMNVTDESEAIVAEEEDHVIFESEYVYTGEDNYDVDRKSVV